MAVNNSTFLANYHPIFELEKQVILAWIFKGRRHFSWMLFVRTGQ
jgi:hypothetical protein